MAQKAIREYDAKSILARHWDKYFPDFTYAYETVMVQSGSELKDLAKKHKILSTKLYEGEASKLYKQELSTPQRIFVGGGGSSVICELDYLYERLADGGIMVANFVTLEHLTTAITTLKDAKIAFDVKSISLTYRFNFG